MTTTAIPTAHRALRLPLAVLLLLVALVIWAAFLFTEARRAAEAAAADTQLCEQLAASIQSLRQKPTMAGLREMESAELTRRIEQAAQAAQIPASCLARIVPEATRRVGESNYREKPTQVLLRQVSLQQAICFLHTLCVANPQLQVKAIRLSAAREQETADRWTAEVTLSYLIYAPAAEAAAIGPAGGLE